MADEGKYVILWHKYASVIHVLLKNTDNETQKLQLYKHEFEHISHKVSTNVSFSLDILNGRAANIVSTTTMARDLWYVLDSNPATRNSLKERNIKVSIGKSLELQLEKIES